MSDGSHSFSNSFCTIFFGKMNWIFTVACSGIIFKWLLIHIFIMNNIQLKISTLPIIMALDLFFGYAAAESKPRVTAKKIWKIMKHGFGQHTQEIFVLYSIDFTLFRFWCTLALDKGLATWWLFRDVHCLREIQQNVEYFHDVWNNFIETILNHNCILYVCFAFEIWHLRFFCGNVLF